MRIDRASTPRTRTQVGPAAGHRPDPGPDPDQTHGGDPSRARDPIPAGPAPLTIDRRHVLAYLDRAGATIARHAARLDRLDAALGDGDHGENMVNGWRAVVDVGAAADDDLGHLLGSIGAALVASVGGASGPLYGTAFIEAGFVLRGRTAIDLAAIAQACDSASSALARRGRCSVGDKTILDALAPACESLRESTTDSVELADALTAAACAAARGMRSTIPLVARRGLALRLGERSRGHQDPGATSCFLLFRAMLPSARRALPLEDAR